MRRQRIIERSGLFDAAWYLEQYPDAAASGLPPLEHYLTVGWRIGRSPGPQFNALSYLIGNREVAAKGHEPLYHYLRHGKRTPQRSANEVIQLVERFQSIGDSCEFGFFQRACGAEPLGLFRFATTTVGGLVRGLQDRFAAFNSPENLRIFLHNESDREFVVAIDAYFMTYHTWLKDTRFDIDKVRAFETKRLDFLARKFIEDLEDGEKILVYKSNGPAPRAKIEKLSKRLRSFGPVTLLWVTEADTAHRAGSVERLSDGLLQGYIDRFAPYAQADRPSLGCWLAICEQAHLASPGKQGPSS
jgi:hypothetical protein